MPPQDSTLPLPPTSSPDLSGSGDGGRGDQIRGLISRLSGGGIGAIEQKLQEHHATRKAAADLAKQRLDQTQRDYVRAQQAAAIAKTPEEKQQAQQGLEDISRKWEIAKGEYTKIAGQSKEAKPILQKTFGVIEHLIGHKPPGQGPAQGPQGGGGAQPSPSSGGGPQLPPPPSAGSSTSASASAAPSQLPPPPDRGLTEGSAAMSAREDQGKAQDARLVKGQEYQDKLKADADPQYHTNDIKQERDDVKAAFPDMKDEDVEKAVLTKRGLTGAAKGAGHEMQPDFKDSMLVGVKDPATNSYYTDPEKMPPEAKAIYDSAKKVEKAHSDEEEKKADTRFRRQMQIQDQAFANAIARHDYDKASDSVQKAKDSYEDAIDRQQTMHKNLEAAAKGDQQAMLSLVANHIGMTLGAQKGARITRAVWDEATQSAPWLQRVKAKFDKDGYLSGVTLTPEQMSQMVRLGDEKVDVLKAHKERTQQELDDNKPAGRRPKMPAPPDGKKSTKIKVTAEDMANAGR